MTRGNVDVISENRLIFFKFLPQQVLFLCGFKGLYLVTTIIARKT